MKRCMLLICAVCIGLTSSCTDLAISLNKYEGCKPLSTHRQLDRINNKPSIDCEGYKATVKEQQPPGTFVTKVVAIDRDPPDAGGTISYSLITKSNPLFQIDEKTGEIKTAIVLDRDGQSKTKEAYITVQAIDNGNPPLADVCTFKVVVEDINDNTPFFDKALYEEQVSEDLGEAREALRVFAYDEDDADNARLVYIIESAENYFLKYFKIDSATGVVYTRKPLHGLAGHVFNATVSVQDRPSRSKPRKAQVNVVVRVVESGKRPPKFTFYPDEPIHLREDESDRNKAIARFSAVSNTDDDGLQYELPNTAESSRSNTFKLTQNGRDAVVTLARSLDYELVNNYTLTVRVVNKHNLAAVKQFIVVVEDVNDEMPYIIDFLQGAIAENEEPGVTVMKVIAVDRDGTSPNNLISYKLEDHSDFFAIDKDNGIITTKISFDRELKDAYYVKVVAYDNAPSALITSGNSNSASQIVKIDIIDRNDKPPRFEQESYTVYEFYEDAEIYKRVISLKATDEDSDSYISYSIVAGNIDEVFAIEEATGTIKVHKHLDFENIDKYALTVQASDGLHNSTTSVVVYIENVNDENPIFHSYEKIINITEEEVPYECIKILSAYDPDKKDGIASNDIEYEVAVNSSEFLAVSDTEDGKICIKLTKGLDRDKPNGLARRQAYIFAYEKDNKKYSAAAELIIDLTDINDNAPYLATLNCTIEENSRRNKVTMLVADDNDSDIHGKPFHYRLSNDNTQDIKEKFFLEKEWLMTNTTFDREEQEYYNILIEVTDSGKPPLTATSIFTVIIGDVNDNAPYLVITNVTYNLGDKTKKIAKLITKDDDTDKNGPPFTYTFSEKTDIRIREKFLIEGDILVATPALDLAEHYNVVIAITDCGNPPLTGESTLKVIVTNKIYQSYIAIGWPWIIGVIMALLLLITITCVAVYLQKRTTPAVPVSIPQEQEPCQYVLPISPVIDVEGIIDFKILTSEEVADGEYLHIYHNEGNGSVAGSLSSVESCKNDEDLDFSFVDKYDSRFQRLLDIYGEGDGCTSSVNTKQTEIW